MSAQATLQNFLIRKFTEAKTRNPNYSLRAFSTRAGIQAGALSGIINGKRKVSRKLALRIIEKLDLDPQERVGILRPFGEMHLQNRDKEDDDYLKISASQFRVLADWEHFAILSLMRTQNFKSDIHWIASRLEISMPVAQAAIDRLIQVGMIESDTHGKLSRIKPRYRTSDDIADISLRKAHTETLDLARQSLERDTVTTRDFSSITMAIDPKKLSEAKELIRKFEDDLSNLVESGTQSEVYRLAIQLFPLSQIPERIKK